MCIRDSLATDYNNLLRAEFPEEYSSEPAGTIIRQTPKAGRTVKEKQRIVLTVSLGTQYVTIPETKNMVAEDAEAICINLNSNSVNCILVSIS